jgi:hypothetical protein
MHDQQFATARELRVRSVRALNDAGWQAPTPTEAAKGTAPTGEQPE